MNIGTGLRVAVTPGRTIGAPAPEPTAPIRSRRREGAGRDLAEPAPSGVRRPRHHDRAVVMRALGLLRGDWGAIAVLGGLQVLSAPLALLAPVPLALAVDSALGNRPLPGPVASLLPVVATSTTAVLVFAAALQIGIVLLSEGRTLLAESLQTWVSERITLDVRSRMLANAHRLSFRYHDSVGTADSIYRIQYDSPSIASLGLSGIIPLITAVITLMSMAFVILRIDLALAVIALGVAPLFVLLTVFYRRRIKPKYKHVKRLESGSLRIVQEIFSAFRVVKAFGMEEREQQRFQEQSEVALQARVRVTRSEGVYSLMLNIVAAGGAASILLVGGLRVERGQLSLGALLLVLSYLSQLFGPIQTLAKQPVKLQSQIVSASRVIELLDVQPEVEDRPRAKAVHRVVGEFRLRDVSFAYDEGQPVLSNVTIDVPPGSRVGIIGKTGAGKSTLVSLLIRFYDVSSGSILLDGIDLRDYRIADLRRQFTMVLQDPFLFATSIQDNIAFGRPTATIDDVRAAAAAAGVHDLVQDLPQGYDTVVGERGMRLSGGERQRISLARAFLKDAPILLLDEPTSSVDVRTEEEIMHAMERLMVGRTTFMIAHRLSTLSGCDMLLEVSEGRIQVVREPRGRARSEPPAADLLMRRADGR